MKRWKGIAVLGALSACFTIGCGQSSGPELGRASSAETPSSSTPSAHVAHASPTTSGMGSISAGPRDAGHHPGPHHETSEAQLASDGPPEAVIGAFLEATRRGDDQLAASLLSRKALEETTKVGLAVKPPGTPSMEYEIAEVEFLDDVADGAYVHSTWTEQFQGTEEQFEVTWVLRQEESGWRIVGMAAELQPGEPPFFLNFEEPSELYRQMQEFAADAPNQGDSDSGSGEERLETASQPEKSIGEIPQGGSMDRF